MRDQIPITCPECGNETLKTRTKVKTYGDLLGCSCAKCGHVITDDDIERQGRKIADEVIRKFGFKKTFKIE